MAERGTEQLLIGSLMRNPKVLLQRDRYQLSTKDFDLPLYQYAFYAIYNMVQDGALEEIPVPEIENWLGKESRGRDIYEGTVGRQTLVDALEQAKETGVNFEPLYEALKKQNLIRDLKREKFDIKEFFVEDAKTDEDKAINDLYNTLKASDILEKIENKLLKIKTNYLRGDSSESQSLNYGLKEMILGLEDSPEIGIPLQGHLFNHIVSGAQAGRFYLRSGSSGLGKTRQAMGDACNIAFPIRYSWEKRKWIRDGQSSKVLIIITEQEVDEIQKMAVAYLTGINESVFKRGNLTAEQKKIINQSFEVLDEYEENFRVVRVPSPSISVVKQVVREHVTLYQTEYLFYDYIFESPSLFAEFQGMNLRTDQMLFMFSDALKNLAVELGIFVMSSTQVNAKNDDSKNIRNEAGLAGSRAVINKADMGCIMARPSVEELKTLEEIISNIGITPNVVTDIYKLRGGEHTQVRIWSIMNLGTLRKQDLFVTDSRLNQVDIDFMNTIYALEEGEEERAREMLERLVA